MGLSVIPGGVRDATGPPRGAAGWLCCPRTPTWVWDTQPAVGCPPSRGVFPFSWGVPLPSVTPSCGVSPLPWVVHTAVGSPPSRGCPRCRGVSPPRGLSPLPSVFPLSWGVPAAVGCPPPPVGVPTAVGVSPLMGCPPSRGVSLLPWGVPPSCRVSPSRGVSPLPWVSPLPCPHPQFGLSPGDEGTGGALPGSVGSAPCPA